jgi:hypothetical protein
VGFGAHLGRKRIWYRVLDGERHLEGDGSTVSVCTGSYRCCGCEQLHLSAVINTFSLGSI